MKNENKSALVPDTHSKLPCPAGKGSSLQTSFSSFSELLTPPSHHLRYHLCVLVLLIHCIVLFVCNWLISTQSLSISCPLLLWGEFAFLFLLHFPIQCILIMVFPSLISSKILLSLHPLSSMASSSSLQKTNRQANKQKLE